MAAAVGASCMGVWSAVSTTAAITLQAERRQGTLELLVASPTSFWLTVVPATISMATIGLWSLVATLVWGRVAFGIPVSFDQPLVFVLAALVLAFSLGLVGFLQAVASVRYRSAWALGSVFEFPVWLICGFLVPLSLLPGLGRTRSPTCSRRPGGSPQCATPRWAGTPGPTWRCAWSPARRTPPSAWRSPADSSTPHASAQRSR